MRDKKRIALLVVLSLGLGSCGTCIVLFMRGASDLAPGVNVRSIRAVALGMTPDEVNSVLGSPLEQVGPDGGPFICGTKPCQPAMIPGSVLWSYSRPVAKAPWYPMLWVEFTAGRVTRVYGKRYEPWTADREGVYLKSTDHPEGWEDSSFESTFRR